MSSANKYYCHSEMVRHIHQDFLSEDNLDNIVLPYCLDDISNVKSHSIPKDLFDIPGKYHRKVNLSFLDMQISTQDEWICFCNTLRDIDCLYLIDDRIIVSPIMADYAALKTKQYATHFAHDNIPIKIVKLGNAKLIPSPPHPNLSFP